ncbi:MAG: tRNA lysidine(34) synthetase TilS [candidate division WOR-3 bacterium]|nr:tRNA lysidine(34) synthetase TilS [candidate division WOR-3 bacterium]MCX7947730.1 tRNA lysidine(34) synthetase TilS [candidate division WOR-3 bacterium]MDW8150347.1 tRNA lysidine(34) synthetase TilS [candidate division WOR-3 bacterium]
MEHVDSLDISSFITQNDKILIAFSGGPDSVFLVKKLLELKEKINFEIGICYINHMLRNEAYEEEIWIRNFAKNYNLKCYIKRANVLEYSKKKKISIETAGRILRYKILKKISKRENYNKIATAHHLDDAFETFILNSIRGSGILGILLKPRRKNIIRPIMLYSKHEILSSLSPSEYLIDKTNFEIHYSRNYIRNEVVSKIREKFPNYIFGFRKTYLNLLAIYNRIESEMKKIYKNSIVFSSRDIKVFKRKEFLSLNSEKVKTFFSKIIKEPKYEHLENISKIIKSGGKINISKNYFFEVREKIIGIYKKPLAFRYLIYIYPKEQIIYLDELNINVSISEKPVIKEFTLNFDLYKISSPIVIRKRKKGDRVGNKKLKEILINYKVPNFLKDFLPVVQKEDRIILAIEPYVENARRYLIIEFLFKKNYTELFREIFKASIT